MATAKTTTRPRRYATLDERRAAGRKAREAVPRSSLSRWEPAPDRPDPVAVIESQNATREPDLVPVRHGRMAISPFTFYRGGAAIMAADLAATPRAGLEVQLCGDAHLSNFGAFASPERELLFDLNDFDETRTGPFEFDVERLAASFVIAARNNGFSEADASAAAQTVVRSYRENIAAFSTMATLDVWYARLPAERIVDLVRGAGGKVGKKIQQRLARSFAHARTRDSLQAAAKLTERVDGVRRIVSQPPIIVPARDLLGVYGLSSDEAAAAVHEQFRAYKATLPPDRRLLIDRFRIVDLARKVVGVGSVGTRAFIVLLEGRDRNDPLFLQVKEATSSVLEPYLRPSRYRLHGERVVRGQRLMQAASDIMLGWTKGLDQSRHFYWRQLRDMKASFAIESFTASNLLGYAEICGWTLARAHARSGDPVAITAYLGKGDRFDRAMVEFSHRYADQNERDYEAFTTAIASGKIEATEG
jgi:uncharacterized protein (DUF2252 family)